MTEPRWHVAPILGVPDVRRAAEYYRDVLGFGLDPVDGVFQPSADEPGGVYAIVARDGVALHLQIRRGDATAGRPPSHERHVYFYVPDVDRVYAELQKRGATVLQPPRIAPYGIKELVVEDLNGWRLAFGQCP